MAEVKERALTPQAKAQSIRALFNDNRVKGEIMKALPKHLTADRLIRVAMTSIQRNPKLLECSQQSLLGCIMTCAALGLEPDQFLGQAYLVPFWNEKKKCYEAQLIPGYRGYIALARRSGDVQTVSAQTVFEKDYFNIMYGISDTLEHKPFLDGERGKPVGSYVVFKYKDGAYSFDFMTYDEIKAIAKRSQTYKKDEEKWTGPWDTDESEMMKKTVIKRHSKLAPLSIEFQRAVALEDRASLGETQMDLLAEEIPGQLIEAETSEEKPDFSAQVAEFDKATADKSLMVKYVEVAAKHFKKSADEIKAEATNDMPGFMVAYEKWAKAQEQKAATGEEKRGPGRPKGSESKPVEPPPENAPVEAKTENPIRYGCPNGGFVTIEICQKCEQREINGQRCPSDRNA